MSSVVKSEDRVHLDYSDSVLCSTLLIHFISYLTYICVHILVLQPTDC